MKYERPSGWAQGPLRPDLSGDVCGRVPVGRESSRRRQQQHEYGDTAGAAAIASAARAALASGDAFGHVEEAAAPFACRLTRLLPALRPQHSIDAMLAEHKLDRLKAWLDAVTDRPSCTSTMPTKEEMVDSSKKMMERIKAMAK